MCLTKRTMSRRSRVFLALGNLCMFTGLVMSRFTQHTTRQFGSGFLLGLAITFLFVALYKARSDSREM